MTSKQIGSTYHLSSLRYKQGSRSIAHTRPPPSSDSSDNHTTKSRLEQLFEKAEDEYRPGQSTSSSLLIRSNVLPIETIDEDNVDAREGIQRTQARAVLAQSMPVGEIDGEDAFLGVQISQVGSSIYLRNRRAKNAMTRASYDHLRRAKRLAKEKAKAKSKGVTREESTLSQIDEDREDEDDNGEQRAEELTREMQREAESLVDLLPSGSLMETIHYLAAHYYDARGQLRGRNGAKSSRSRAQMGEEEDDDELHPNKTQSATMWRVGEGSALVALAVYLEETIKNESVAEPSEELQLKSSTDNAHVAANLEKIQRANKNKKRRKAEKPVSGKASAKRFIESGWARKRRRRAVKVYPILENSDRDDQDQQSSDEDEDEDEEGNDND